MVRVKTICHYCGREISKSNIAKHIKSHKENPDAHREKIFALTHDGLNCQFCGKECKNRNSLCNHERLCKLNPNHQITSGFNKFNAERKAGHVVSWNKGLTAETDTRVAKYTETRRNRIKSGEIIFHSRPHANTYCSRYKYGTYNGFYCDSSWELAFVMYCLDHNLPVERNLSWFEYTDSCGNTKRFYPDFKIGDTYYEIKGGGDLEAENKRSCFPDEQNLVWIDSNEIKPYLSYAKSKYGEDFITMYDPSLPSWLDRSK